MGILNSKKVFVVILSSVLILAAVVIIFISPLTKYLVEKYDEKYLGREIKMDWAYVNPFTGYVYFSNIRFFELKSDSVFLSINGLSGNFEMLKMINKTYEITQLKLYRPRGVFIQNKKELNIDDLISLFTPKKTEPNKEPVHLNFKNISIVNGEFTYIEKVTPVNYSIKEVNFESTEKRWNSDTIAFKFSFRSGKGNGSMKGNSTINFKNLNYRCAVVVHDFNLDIIEQYLKALTNSGSFRASIDASIDASGNLISKEDVTFKGSLTVNDFHFGKNPKEDYVAFDTLSLKIIELSPKNHKYIFDSASVTHPHFKYERYDYLDNVEMMFGKNGSNIWAISTDPNRFNLVIEIARYIKVLGKNFFSSYYRINRLAIYNGDLEFNDYSLSEKFAMGINRLNIVADSIDKNRNRVKVNFKSDIRPYGNVSLGLSISPKDSADFDLQYSLQKLPVAMFNPYIISYTSFPLDRGTLELNGNWNVRNGIIKSENHVLVIDPRVTKRVKNKQSHWLPLPLAMSFMRESGNVIDYEIPITGNLKDPKFHLKDVISDCIGNIFIKPATTPYRMQVKNIEREIEKGITLTWPMRKSTLSHANEKFIENMADFIKENPAATISVSPINYNAKEKEYILFNEVKKKYFLSLKIEKDKLLSKDDFATIDKMSIKDSLFIKYLNKKTNDSTLYTVQEKCEKLIDASLINFRFKQLKNERDSVFISYFKEKGVEKSVKILPADDQIPYNGFSYYKIVYNGELPESLTKAYRELNELNDKAPRKQFESLRAKNKPKL